MQQTSIKIINKLRSAGYEAYWAGGCVRDILLGINPKDFDIVTSARPDEIEKMFGKTLKIGKQFGIMVAIVDGNHYEIATYRSEGVYSDRRRPDEVFWTNAKEDAFRRDFTINGMFYDPINKKVIDYVGGQEDLKNKIIKFIGNPTNRIKEDHLRIIRAIRFKNVLGFSFDKRTYEAIINNSYLIESVSYERIRDELNKMLVHTTRASSLIDLKETGILKHILPEIEKTIGVPQPDLYHHEGDVFTHTLWAIKSLPAETSLTLAWAVLLHDVGKPDTISLPKSKNDRIRFNKHVKYSAGIASKIARRLKFSNTERELIVWLVKNHMMVGDIPKMAIAKQRRWLMDLRFPWLLKLNKADALGSDPKNLSLYEKNLKLYDDATKLHKLEMKKPKFKLFVNGCDIMRELKLESSPEIGKLLKIVDDAQLEGKIKSKKEAISYLRKIKDYG
ncbi:MAG: hypothetical protein ACD_58C00122G0008 [uncultured bacterium]|nr:MAG: hypothetical protein ACD_58C00122G0008 [uncultured bacterium]